MFGLMNITTKSSPKFNKLKTATTKTPLKFGKLKIASLIVGLMLYIIYDYLPLKRLELHDFSKEAQVVMLDKAIGGDTEFSWVARDQNQWICEVKGGLQYPFCSMTIILGDSPETPYYDLSAFSEIQVEIDYKGPSKYIRFFVRNHFDVANNENGNNHVYNVEASVKNDISYQEIQEAKFNALMLPTQSLGSMLTIPMSEFRVPDWWIEQYAITPHDNKPDLSRALGVGVDISNPFTVGKHEFQINKIVAVGSYISKETMYLFILVFFGLIFILELTLQFFKLRSNVQQSTLEINQLGQENLKFKKLAHHDHLSNALNRQGLEQVIETLRAKNQLANYAILLIDIDDFKSINDKYGHSAGDVIISQISSLLKDALRSDDYVCRWGGEEFIVLFSCSDLKSVRDLGEKLRTQVAAHNFNLQQTHQVTISAGAVQLMQYSSFESALKRADELLYEAKNMGKNKVVCCTECNDKVVRTETPLTGQIAD